MRESEKREDDERVQAGGDGKQTQRASRTLAESRQDGLIAYQAPVNAGTVDSTRKRDQVAKE